MKIKNTNSLIRKSLYSAFVFFGTLMILSVGYSAWNSTMSKVNSGDHLSTSGWNALVDNIGDLDGRWARNGAALVFTGGNVGIGTVSPMGKLSVGFNNGDQLNVYSPGDNILSIQTSLDEQPLGTYGGNAANLSLQPLAGIVTMAVNGTGAVAIGTNSPWAKLHVVGDTLVEGNLTTSGAIRGNYGLTPSYTAWGTYGLGEGGAAIYNDNSAYKKLMIVGNTSSGGLREVGIWDNLTINGNTITGNIYTRGALGIWTSNPRTALDVNGSSILGDSLGYALFSPKPGTNPFGTDYDRFEIRVDAGNQVTWLGNTHGGTGSPRALSLMAGASEGIRITTTGNVGIGTSVPGQKLSVVGTIESTSGGFKFPDGTTQATAASGGISSEQVLSCSVTVPSNTWATCTTPVCPTGFKRSGCSYKSATSWASGFSQGAWPEGDACKGNDFGGSGSYTLAVYIHCIK